MAGFDGTTERELTRAAEIIRSGGLVAFPTETVYGLAADAGNPLAVARIFEAKGRPSFDPLIVHIARHEQLFDLTDAADERLALLAERFWPGPLTLVVPKRPTVPNLVTADLPTVGVRMPAHPLALELIRRSGVPLAAPSANRFGRVSPTRAEHVRRELPAVDCVLDGGPASFGIESTVIALDDDGFVLLRPGAVTREEIERLVPASPRAAAPGGAASPGLLASHYSPATPLFLAGDAPADLDPRRCGYLAFGDPPDAPYLEVAFLSRTRDPREAAANLFDRLHAFEPLGLAAVVADPVPETGLGVAIMDRLRKAAHRHRRA